MVLFTNCSVILFGVLAHYFLPLSLVLPSSSLFRFIFFFFLTSWVGGLTIFFFIFLVFWEICLRLKVSFKHCYNQIAHFLEWYIMLSYFHFLFKQEVNEEYVGVLKFSYCCRSDLLVSRFWNGNCSAGLLLALKRVLLGSPLVEGKGRSRVWQKEELGWGGPAELFPVRVRGPGLYTPLFCIIQ